MRTRRLASITLVILTCTALVAPAAGTPPAEHARPSAGGAAALDAAPSPGPLFPRPPVFDNHVYHHYPDLTTELQDLASQYPDTSKLTSIGQSVQGRELWQMEITDFGAPDQNKSTVYIDGGHHGNEQLGMELALQLVHEALYGQLSTPELLRQFHFFIVPMINPDGNTMDQRTNANGVDLNRNYGFEWTDESNHGSGPESEPEAHFNAENMRAVDEEYGMDLYLSGHTGTNILIYSWAWSNDPAPDDALLHRIGAEANNLTGVSYGQTSQELYIATGSSKDMAYGELGAPAFTYEVDDQQNRFGTYTTSIAERLSEEIRTCIFVILNAPKYRADLEVTGVELVEAQSGSPGLKFAVVNHGWAVAQNVALVVSAPGVKIVDGPSDITVPPEGTLDIVLGVEGSGVRDVHLSLVYDDLQVNTSSSTQVDFDGTVDLGGGDLAALAAAGGGAALVLAAAVVVAYVVDRRTGGRLAARVRPAFGAVRSRFRRA